MPSHILVNNLGLTYKSTAGISTATIPDVCKTPSPGGPIPIPYPNIAQQSSLKGGTKTVKAKGKMIAVKGSQYSRSNGDEAGTAGGVKSSVNMKATDWITYSFDVKMDGKNACRHTDKKFHNNKNTVDLQGNFDPVAAKKEIMEVFCDCVQKVKASEATNPSITCIRYGTRVHDCCNDELRQRSDFDGERGYDPETGDRLTHTDEQGNMVFVNSGEQALELDVAFAGKGFPDACALDSNGDVAQFFDFKTTCPKGNAVETDKNGLPIYDKKYGNYKQSASGDPVRSKFNQGLSFKKNQFSKYKKIGKNLDPPAQKDPEMLHDSDCP